MLRLLAAILLLPALAGAQPAASPPAGTASEPPAAPEASINLFGARTPAITGVVPDMGDGQMNFLGKGFSNPLPALKLDPSILDKAASVTPEGALSFPDRMREDAVRRAYAELALSDPALIEQAQKIAASPNAYFRDSFGNKIPADQIFTLGTVAMICDGISCAPANQSLQISYQLLKTGEKAAGANAANAAAASTANAPLTGPGGKYPTYNACIAAGECMGPPSPEPDPAISQECPGPGGVPCSPEYIAKLQAQKNFCPLPDASAPLIQTGADLTPPIDIGDPIVPREEREAQVMRALQELPAEADAGTRSQPEPPAFGDAAGGGRTAEAEGQISAPEGQAVRMTSEADRRAYAKSAVDTAEAAADFIPRDIADGSRVIDARNRIDAQLGNSADAQDSGKPGAVAQAHRALVAGKAAAQEPEANPEGAAALVNAGAYGNDPSLPKTCVTKKQGILGSTDIALDASADCSAVPAR